MNDHGDLEAFLSCRSPVILRARDCPAPITLQRWAYSNRRLLRRRPAGTRHLRSRSALNTSTMPR
ncbi:hypothetical protein BZL29_7888 [Mycobacterium kansasii]|uniref:Uncharacterized protein n=1 Tax=Mycobacterium kansasii TaxID=1768 RepID=A0A1V3WEH7_MYCKA|nr:hypothetical protein BZL29_7888 [Mycobacterium kansasii]